jgi:hypothetical protein
VCSSFDGAISINSLDSFCRLYYLKIESVDLKIFKFVTVKDFICVYSAGIKVGTVQGRYKRLATNQSEIRTVGALNSIGQARHAFYVLMVDSSI